MFKTEGSVRKLIYAGCDIGTLQTKVVLIEEDKIIARDIIPTEARAKTSAELAMNKALSEIDGSLDDIGYCIGCGWGLENIPFINEVISDKQCGASGVHHYLKNVRTFVDVGGLFTRAVQMDPDGFVLDYVMNDKCASGTGRFLEMMAEALEIEPKDFDRPELNGDDPVNITSQCSVFAESEVITYVNEGAKIPNIISGINKSIASKISTFVRRLGIIEDFTIIGGVGKNKMVVKHLQEIIKTEIRPLEVDIQLIPAIGAAILASRKGS
ncbi:MAG: hypothetical protein GF329_10305 [Candidatus Lokiarchaeota archaeon]|nr:hypothetical protein [Candidatus Lokiarchaeota archaeon]